MSTHIFQIALKNRNNLTLNERVLTLESNVKDVSIQLSTTSEAARMEAETRQKLDQRNMELELLVAKLRGREGDGNNSDFEGTRWEWRAICHTSVNEEHFFAYIVIIII